MAGEILLASQFAAAGLLLALAAWLLSLNFGSRLNRAFALFLFLRAMAIVTNRLPDVLDGLDRDYFQRVSPYFLIGAGVSLAYFAITYPRPPRALPQRVALVGALAVGGGAALAYAVDHCLVVCTTGGRDLVGPLAPLALLLPIVSGLAAWRLAAQARAGGPGSSALRTVALGFAVNAAVDSVLSLTIVLSNGDAGAGFDGAPWRYLPHPFIALALLPLAGYLAASRTLRDRRRAAAFLAVGLAAATGMYVGLGLAGGASLFLIGLWRFALAATVAYALVRQSLFDLDARLRFTIKQSSIGAVFVTVFFVASEAGAEIMTERFSGLLGLAAAALLIFALSPLQFLAEKLARTALPGPAADRDLPLEMRHEIYREQVGISWADGTLDRSERLVLERLREALALTRDEAATIELDVARRL